MTGDPTPEHGEGVDVERFELHGLVIEHRGTEIRLWREDSQAGDDLREHFLTAGETATHAAEEMIESLRQLLLQANPIHLVGQVAAWATAGAPDVDDTEVRHGVEAEAEYLCGLALSIEGRLCAEPAGPFEVQRYWPVLARAG